jgi:arginase family enzyme
VHLQHALDGAPTYVHLDVDVLDEAALPLPGSVPGGLPAEKLLDLLDAVADSCEVVGLEVCGFAPTGEAERRDELAGVVVSALEPLLAALTADAVT